MNSFLGFVAHDLYSRYGDSLSDLAIIFPSRRARLFFTDELGALVDRPFWQPRWSSIDELMCQISGLRVADRLRLITELYKIYSEFHQESFDKFYFWGEMLLADFDTIDKYRIDADMLFRNIDDIKQIEADISYLTERQLAILSFWSNFGDGTDLTEAKRNFLRIWATLGPIYNRFRAHLNLLGIAYNGMVQRAAADRLKGGDYQFAPHQRYVVVGFNALTECEKQLFKALVAADLVEFYWDYDTYYKDDHTQESGMFVRSNLADFPPAAVLPDNNMRQQKQISSVACLSNAIQCKYAAQILSDLTRAKIPLDKRTAIVLTDENLLMPLLYALPKDIGAVNVTMGYPLKQSLAYTFIERLIELQNHRTVNGTSHRYYHTDVTGLLSHPYLIDSDLDQAQLRKLIDQIQDQRRITVDGEWISPTPLLRQIFSPAVHWREISDWLLSVVGSVAALRMSSEGSHADNSSQRYEYLSVIAENISKLRNSLDSCDIDLTPEVYASLLRRHLQTIRIPFDGEPLQGIQIMGILETRCLDFDNVILLSMTDANFPGNHMTQSSFVPHNLRVAYNLPTPDHHEGVYAYYFYRLIQRARTINMLYCSQADDKSTGERSRYIYQLDYESGMPIEYISVSVDVNLAATEAIVIEKDPQILASLERFVNPKSPATLSPTAFYRYVACPLRFYFHSIARLRTEDLVCELVDAPMFGSILHAAIQRLYTAIIDEQNPGQKLRAMLRTGAVGDAVSAAINELYLCDERASAENYTGNLLLIKDIVERYISGGVIPFDAAHDSFRVTALEQPIDFGLSFPTPNGPRTLKFAGIADRVDTLSDGSLRVVDYKTGSAHLDFEGLDKLFHGQAHHRQSNTLQTMLYAMMLHRKLGADVEPALYYVRSMNRPDYSSTLIDRELKAPVLRYSHYADDFEALIRSSLSELYDPSIPFSQCEDPDTCKYCDFNALCKR